MVSSVQLLSLETIIDYLNFTCIWPRPRDNLRPQNSPSHLPRKFGRNKISPGHILRLEYNRILFHPK